MDTDAETALIERRWFASMEAARRMQAECDVLREVMDLAEASWRRARSQLSRFEAARDALGKELAQRDARLGSEQCRWLEGWARNGSSKEHECESGKKRSLLVRQRI